MLIPVRLMLCRFKGLADKVLDLNRALVLNANRLRDIINLLADDSILAFVIPVLYNILVDYGKHNKIKRPEHNC